MSGDFKSAGWSGSLSPQQNLWQATGKAFEALEGQTDDQLRWLGAEPQEHVWNVLVLGSALAVDLASRRVVDSTGQEIGPLWRILVLHYLAIRSRPDAYEPELVFADLPTARSYAGVYHQRVIARLCATVGRDRQRLCVAAESLGGRPIHAGDAAFDFGVFPRLTLRLIWHAADEEFPPSATLLLPANVESYFCAEDVVVLSECLVARLQGRPF